MSYEIKPLISNVLDLLMQQHVVISGGKVQEGYPILTFPDTGNFIELSAESYEKLISYITSVPSLQKVDLGFVAVVDRRNDKWSSVRCVLLQLDEFFPGFLHTVYVIRPSGFLQKAISEVSNKFFKEDFKFKVVICSTIEELHDYVDLTELTVELGGTLPYFHQYWIQQRMALESFSIETYAVSSKLNEFTERLTVDTTDLPDTKEQAADILFCHSLEFSKLKKHISEAVKKGESLLNDFKQDTDTYHGTIPSTVTNVAALERLLVQMDETEKVFDNFWERFSGRLKQCHSLRIFEENFNIVQSSLNKHLEQLSEMTDVGDSVDRVEILLEELVAFQKSSLEKMKMSEELLHNGGELLSSKRFIVLESVQPKCDEVQRLTQTLNDRLEKRLQTLTKSCELQARIQKASEWCAKGVKLLGSDPGDKNLSAEQALVELEEFMSSAHHLKVESPREFYSLFEDTITPETKPIVTQVLQRLDDVTTMCDKRLASLKRLINKPRPVQSVNPEPAIPIQLSNAAKLSNIEDKSNADIHHIEEINASKTKHVLTELLYTERQYSTELGSILKGYKDNMEHPEMKNLVPTSLKGKSEILFGNIESIYSFHSQFFLPALENCSTSTESVAVCFTDNREKLLQLYTYYCVNLARSEELRETVGENNSFFKTCQEKLGHRLPLGAYLLLPMQRITKYQLLIKELLNNEKNSNCINRLQKALDCMLLVLNNVNDNMHQIGITGYHGDWNDLGGLLLQGSFSVWVENKKDILKELRLKPMRRQIFLYQQGLLLCKKVSKENKPMYHFKKFLRMENIGLTETVKGDVTKFEVWLEGRQEVYTIQASNIQQKQQWVSEIKRVLLEQLAELKGEKIKQYISAFGKHVNLRQTQSLDNQRDSNSHRGRRPLSHHETTDDDSSDYSLSDDESLDETIKQKVNSYISLADYNALRPTDATLKRGDKVDLLKAGSSSWWYVKVHGSKTEGWVPAAHLEISGRKSSHSSQSLCSHGSTSTD